MQFSSNSINNVRNTLKYPTPFWVYESVVYEIFPDRFSIGKGKSVQDKASLYIDRGGTIKEWDEKPVATGDWRSSQSFYGGDLWGVGEKLDYLKDLGVNCLYLTPIFSSPSNHKYDGADYFKVDSQFGGNRALTFLVSKLKRENMRLVLDGVFNHVSSQHKWFVKAKNGNRDAMSKFTMYESGHRGWWGAQSLPELNLEELEVRNYITQVIHKYLKMGIDGWRLDCGQDLGPVNNAFIASKVKSISTEKYVVSELWTYPEGWNMVDGIMNYHLRELILSYLNGELNEIGSALTSVFNDTPNIYGCWNMLDSHDSERIANVLPDKSLRKLAVVLQFTYPGVPVVYYGSEVGLEGGRDPECRDTMKWNEETWDTELREFYKKIIALRKTETALKIGAFEVLNTDPLVFLRKAPYMLDDIVVAINRSNARRVAAQIKDGRLLDRTRFVDLFTGEKFSLSAGLLKFDIPERGFRLLKPLNDTVRGYDQYKRIF